MVYINPELKRVVVNAKDPETITNLIPRSRKFMFKGRPLVAIHHGLEETRLLRNLGLKVPSPAKYHYDFPGKYKPFEIQKDVVDHLILNPRAYNLSSLGVGKTLSTLWAWHYLKREGLSKKLLVIAPLSTLERVWADELFNNLGDVTSVVLHGDKSKRLKLLAADYDVYIINHDGVRVIENDLIARKDIDTVVIDELSAFRNHRAERWKSVNKVISGRTRVWGLTGSPTPNEPVDAYGQSKLITPANVPMLKKDFKETVMKQITNFKWEARPDAQEKVDKILRPSIRFELSDVAELPEVVYQQRQVQMSHYHKQAYSEMLKSLVTEVDNKQITAINEASKLTKLLQISAGCVYNSEGEIAEVVGFKDRIEVVKEYIDASPSKTIVFAAFKSVVDVLERELKAEYDPKNEGDIVFKVTGDTPAHERARIFGLLQSSDRARVLCAHPAAMAHGINLQAASTIVWYGPVLDGEIWLQANGRIRRPGQKNKQLIVSLISNRTEKKCFDRLQTKEKIQGILLDIVKERTVNVLEQERKTSG